MEIGALAILIINLAICCGEHTKSGEKFFNWFGKKFFDIDLEQMED